MYCTNCGQQLVDNANFCGHCGQRIIQADLVPEANTVKDLITDKAEDIVIQDDNLSSCDNLKNDDVAQKASYIGEISYPKASNIPSSVQRGNDPQYIETRNTFFADYLIRIKRENTSTHRVSYCLLNTISNRQSEWFDCIKYCGYNTFYIERNGLKGLMENSFVNYQLWDQMDNPADSYYCVIKNGKWAVITIQHKKIEQVTAYEEFVEGAAIVKQNGKYGYILYDKDTNEMRIVPCVLDDAHEFAAKDTLQCLATVIYQGRSYKMDKKGNLCVKEEVHPSLGWAEIIVALIFWIFLWWILCLLCNVILNGMSFSEACNDVTSIIIAIVFSIGTIVFMAQDKEYRYVPKMNIALSRSNEK